MKISVLLSDMLNGCVLDTVDRTSLYVLIERFTLDGKSEISTSLHIRLKQVNHTVRFRISTFNVLNG